MKNNISVSQFDRNLKSVLDLSAKLDAECVRHNQETLAQSFIRSSKARIEGNKQRWLEIVSQVGDIKF